MWTTTLRLYGGGWWATQAKYLFVFANAAIVGSCSRLGFQRLRDVATVVLSLTGQQAVDLLGVKRGDRVLVSGALGAVGRVAVQYLQELGAVPVAGVRAARFAEGRALAGDALDIDLAPSSPDFDYAIAVAARGGKHRQACA